MKDMRGSDVVIIGFLVYLVWKEYNSPSSLPDGSMQAPYCNVTNVPNASEPISTMYGPAWTRLPPENVQP